MSCSLPNDILLLVGEFLEDHQDRYNLLFVCNRFCGLFRRLVYRHAALKNCDQIRAFLTAILPHPELARAVRSLDFDQWQLKPATSVPQAGGSRCKDDMVLFRDWAREISQSEEEYVRWEQDLLHDVEEAWIALLLPLVRNVKRLRLVYPKQNVYLDRTMQRAVRGEKPFHLQPALRSLQEVSLGHLEREDDDAQGTFVPSQIAPFFQFPSLRVITAESVIESASTQEDEDQSPMDAGPLSGISEIVLNSSSGANGMNGLLAACASLTTFKYQHSDAQLLSEGYRPSAFCRSLARSRHRHTLRTLWLDTCGHHLPFTIAGANMTHDEWFGSLADFPALQNLRIRLPNLVDIRYQAEPSVPLTEILPAGLESLYVEGCKETALGMLVAQLKLVLGKRGSRFRGLKRLEIEGLFHDEEDSEDSSGSGGSAPAGNETLTLTDSVIRPRVYGMVEPLRTACAEAGVELFVRDRACLQTMT
ncbi:uncharacterized protein ACLA_074420 [Aspergillus clavatus NRRL 1]|uniref:Leucine-rich repeat domain-containing protein n=1 Tax=Aspergillus clavatus (strain ATCC 1007 / CBS 513.65 / DSM 816 / NCTC 3887 / NRRL 1 / QM 1276 / 107) TaxID=344612 RepID=A1C7N4_ASPCL|nr:uncharacterized protein ACLA_074420 [Aspergillus clavatus NRRL 1]EAW14405.1 conserved hypothetical protein [Aspergillus clavatus NRRL 1]